MNLTVGIRRAVDEDKGFPAFGFGANLPVDILFAPMFRHFRFAQRQAGTHREGRFGQI